MGLMEFQKPVNSRSKDVVEKGQKKVVEGQRLQPVMDGVDVLSQPLNQDWGHLP